MNAHLHESPPPPGERARVRGLTQKAVPDRHIKPLTLKNLHENQFEPKT